jgi:hypothetical protein
MIYWLCTYLNSRHICHKWLFNANQAGTPCSGSALGNCHPVCWCHKAAWRDPQYCSRNSIVGLRAKSQDSPILDDAVEKHRKNHNLAPAFHSMQQCCSQRIHCLVTSPFNAANLQIESATQRIVAVQHFNSSRSDGRIACMTRWHHWQKSKRLTKLLELMVCQTWVRSKSNQFTFASPSNKPLAA